MAEIRLGQQFDDSKSHLDVTTDGGGGLLVSSGDLHDRSAQSVRVGHATSGHDGTRAAAPTPEGDRQSSSRIRAVGVILIAAIAVTVTSFGVVANQVRPVFVPLVIAAAVVVLYLTALAILPPQSARGIAKFGSTLRDFMQLVLGQAKTK